MIPFHHCHSIAGRTRRRTGMRKGPCIRAAALFLCFVIWMSFFPILTAAAEEEEKYIQPDNGQMSELPESGQAKEESGSPDNIDVEEKGGPFEEETKNPGEAQDPEETENPGETLNPEETKNPGGTLNPEETKNSDEAQTPEKTKAPEGMPVPKEEGLPIREKLFMVSAAADAEAALSTIVQFDKIALYYAGADGQPEEEAFQDGDLIEKGRQLILQYGYTITEAQCENIVAGTQYYLDVSPHLRLPELSGGSSLMIDLGGGVQERFGMIYADGSRAWIVFDAEGNGTVLSKYGELENAFFYLNCYRADEPPADENPVDGQNNLYVMKFENGERILKFGYAEKEPFLAKADIKKSGTLKDGTITWGIDYTPWQNPSAGDGVTMDSAFELRDRIDNSLHQYVDGSAQIGGVPIPRYSSYDEIKDNIPDAYMIVEEDADGTSTTLIFGGTKLNAGNATQGDKVQALKITYETSVNVQLPLPGDSGEKTVANEARLFAGENGIFNDMMISGKSSVTVPPPVWLEKTGQTTRLPNGQGSVTEWKITFFPNGFSSADLEELTLHDQLPESSKLVPDSVQADGQPVNAVTDVNNGFTISPVTIKDGSPVNIIYQTQVPEEKYDQGTDLGNNTAWFTFKHNGTEYFTPTAITPVGSGSGDDGEMSDTAVLVKTNGGYDAAARTIDWTVKINPHRAYFKEGTFADLLKEAGGGCGKSGHDSGLELLDGSVDKITVLIDGQTPTAAEWDLISLSYNERSQRLEIEIGEIGYRCVTIQYTTKVCDPCVFANNTTKMELTNTISTDDMVIGRNETKGRSDSASSTAVVNAVVLSKKEPVYHYDTGRMEWTVEVNGSELPMEGVILKDTLPDGLTYIPDSFHKDPENPNAAVSLSGQELAIELGKVTEKTTITFETSVSPEKLGFGGDGPVPVKNTIHMYGSADGVAFEKVSDSVEQNFVNHGLVKSGRGDNRQELIQYEVLINPFGLTLPDNPEIVDTLDKSLQLDWDTLRFYKASVSGSIDSAGQKPSYKIVEGSGQPLQVTGFDPAANCFTVQLPVQAGSKEAYVLTYTADIIDRQAGGYGNSVRFEGGTMLLGGSKINRTIVGGGGGGGVAARKAGITIIKKDAEEQKPLAGVTFVLYQWDSVGNARGLAIAQGITDAQGMLTFKVKPGAAYELVEKESVSGYSNEMKWETLPNGVTATDAGLLVMAGEKNSELRLELTNEACVPGTDPDGGGGGGTTPVDPDGPAGSGDSGTSDGAAGSGGSDDAADSGRHDSSAGTSDFAGSGALASDAAGDFSGFGPAFRMIAPVAAGVSGPADGQEKNGRSGNMDVPQTGDRTLRLIVIIGGSGILLGVMTRYLLLRMKEMKGKKMFRFLYAMALCVFMSSGTALAFQLMELQRGDAFYEQVRGVEANRSVVQKEEQEELDPDLLKLCNRFTQFAAEYPEAVAWLQLPDTAMDYPVMSGRDNRFYLDHLPDGSKNAMGSLFLDCRVDENSPHLIIYGHNGLNEKMFGLLKQYESPDYFAEHRTLTIVLEDAVYVCPIFSVRYVQADSEDYRLDFEDRDALADYIERAAAESLYPTDVHPEGMTRVLTLSTCTGRSDQRLVVQAILPFFR